MAFKRLSLLTVLTLSVCCGYAEADPYYTGTILTADHGFILSAEGSYSWLLGTPNKPMDSTIGGSHEVGGFGWGANLGYAWPIDALTALGLEVGYADNGQNYYKGNAEERTLKIESRNYQLLGSFNTIWESGINFFFKLGAAVLDQKAEADNPTINGTQVGNFTNHQYYLEPMMVLGVGYKITPRINIYVEGSGIYGNLKTSWSSVGTSPNKINGPSAVVAIKAGLSYAFSE